MKPFTWCLGLFLAFLAGCKGELTGVTVNLAADGSGDCQVIGIRDVQHQVGENGNPDGVMQGTVEAQVIDLQIRTTTAKFAAVKDLKIGDITFALEKLDGRELLTVRIPAAVNAKWFGAFGVPESSLSLWNRLEDESRRRDEARRKTDPKAANGAFHAPQPPNVTFTINLPGRLEGQVFEAAPLGLTTKIAMDRGERSASLSIPLSEIHAGTMREVVWKVSYSVQ